MAHGLESRSSMLQRGRRPRTPERRYRRLSGQTSTCFNGAGVRGRRRATSRRARSAGSTRLQRGRRPRTPESWPGAESCCAVTVASTGPASEDAGELTRALTDPAGQTGFNGAGVRGRRRAGAKPPCCLLPPLASTGPASEDAGEPPCQQPSSARSSGFNGAGVRGRRREVTAGGAILDAVLQRGRRPRTPESSCRGTPWAASPCFNGAGVRGRRRGEKVLEIFRRRFALQRGRRPRTPERNYDNHIAARQRSLQRGRRPRTPERPHRGRRTSYEVIVLQRGRRPRTPERRGSKAQSTGR